MTVKVADQSAADRLMQQIESSTGDCPALQRPIRYQVAMVLHALADHTAITGALQHRPDPDSRGPKLRRSGDGSTTWVMI